MDMASSAQKVRVRKNVRTLGQTPNDDLTWYSRAVAELKLLPFTDSTSWRFQAAVHGYNIRKDPNRGSGGPLPPPAVQKRFWNKCQHQTWYFLPWHRGYLAFFEQIVTAAVVKLGGPSDWALPYWNYSDSDPKSRLMPDAFIKSTLPDGSLNPLFVNGRSSSTNDFHLRDQTVSLECLVHSPFAGVGSGGDPGFGGPKTRFSHSGGTNGRLENAPHNLIHDQIGGLMGAPETAALDPIFWLHHANIDRLWEVWTHRDPTFKNPTDSQWLTGQSFELHDASGTPQTYTSDQMQDTTTVLHGYQYDDISDPVRVNPPLVTHALRFKIMSPMPQPPQLVGTSKKSIPVAGPVTTAEVTFNQPMVRIARRNLLSLSTPRVARAYLNLENVTGSGQPGTYDVYIDATPPGQQPDIQRAIFVGSLSTFGIEAASRKTGSHAGSGLTTVLEITDQLEMLRTQRGWDNSRLHVLLAKEPPGGADSAERISPLNLKVGRISVYYH
jgi:tyrosinase